MRSTALLLLSLAACNTGFEPQYLVKDVRVLAVRAHVEGSAFADATPGDTVILQALVANPLGRPVTVRWYGCAPEPDESLPPCADPEFLRDPSRLAADPRVLPLGAGETISVPVPDVTAALDFLIGIALAEPAFQCRLFAELPVVAVVEWSGPTQLALKRVRLAPTELPPELAGAYDRNFNPEVLEILRGPAGSDACAGGAPLDAAPPPPGDLVLCAFEAPGSIGRYQQCDPDGVREATTEKLSWQWYVTAGEFPEFDGIGNATGGSVDFVRPAAPFTLWSILRDGRGGEAWARRDVAAAP